MPRSTLRPASVTMNAGMPSNAMNHPCTVPTAPPSTSITRTTAGHGTPACSTSAASALTSATVEPTERSMPPVVMTRVMATATISIGALWRMRFNRLTWVRKASVATAKNRQTRTKNAAMLRTGAWAARKSCQGRPCGRAVIVAASEVVRATLFLTSGAQRSRCASARRRSAARDPRDRSRRSRARPPSRPRTAP